jgi:putative selenoprotein
MRDQGSRFRGQGVGEQESRDGGNKEIGAGSPPAVPCIRYSSSFLLYPVPCTLSHLVTIFRAAWNYLREASGENDYARYRARALAQEGPVMTEEAFYLWQLHRKYSRINRCC